MAQVFSVSLSTSTPTRSLLRALPTTKNPNPAVNIMAKAGYIYTVAGVASSRNKKYQELTAPLVPDSPLSPSPGEEGHWNGLTGHEIEVALVFCDERPREHDPPLAVGM